MHLPATSLFAFFQSPLMLIGLSAVSIPIILHFFFRSRFRVVPWGAMKFLLTSIEQTSRRLKFQEIPLLVTRCVLVALVALALALPTLQSQRAGGLADASEPLEVVLLFDTSFSMNAREGTSNRLKLAKERARGIIDKLPPNSSVHVVTCSNRATLPDAHGEDSSALAGFGNPEAARAVISVMQAAAESSDLEPGVRQALGILERGQSPNQRLFIFSDMHKLGWEKNGGAIARQLQGIKDSVGVYLVHVEKQKVQNVAVTGIAPQAPVPRPGEPCGFSLLVKNTGTDSFKDLRVGLFIDGAEEEIKKFLDGAPVREDLPSLRTAAVQNLSPGETRLVSLVAEIKTPGLHVLTACVSGDDLPTDNRFDLVLDVREQVQVLVVDGGIDTRDAEKSSSFYLMHAMLPIKEGETGSFHLTPKLVPPRLASPADLDKSALCILVNVQMPKATLRTEDDVPDAFIVALKDFVTKGKGLLIFAGENVKADDYNRVLGKQQGLLPYPLGDLTERTLKNPLSVSRATATLPAYMKFKNDPLYDLLDAVVVLKAFQLKEAPAKDGDKKEEEHEKAKEKKTEDAKKDDAKKDAKDKEAESSSVALRYDNDAPAVAVRRVGAGEVFFVTTSADQGVKKETGGPTWNLFSKFPLGRVYVPFIQTTLAHMLQQQSQSYNVVAGDSLVWAPTEKEPQRYSLMRPDKSIVRLGVPEKKEHRQELALTNFDIGGVYRLKSAPAKTEKGPVAERPGTPLAVVPDLKESENLESLSETDLNRLLGFTPVHWLADGTQRVEEAIEAYDPTIAHWLLVVALFLAFFEVGLAFWCSHGW